MPGPVVIQTAPAHNLAYIIDCTRAPLTPECRSLILGPPFAATRHGGDTSGPGPALRIRCDQVAALSATLAHRGYTVTQRPLFGTAVPGEVD